MHVGETRPLRVGELAKATGLTVRTLHHDDEIGLLREGEDPRPAVRRHLERIDEQLRLARRLRTRLTSILDLLDRADEPSSDQFIEAIEVMTRMERYYTPEQLEQLEQRADAIGEDGLRRAEAEWAELIAAVEAERAAGTDPADAKLGPLVERWS